MTIPAGRRDHTLLAVVVAITLAALTSGYLASRALTQRVTQAHALTLARDFTGALAGALTVFDGDGRFVGIEGGEKDAVLRFARRVAHIDRMLAIGPDRIVVFDSADGKTGQRYDKPYIRAALDHAEATVMFADPDDTGLGEDAAVAIAEAYVPVLRDGHPVGVFELYLDVTDTMASVASVFAIAFATFAAAVLAAMVVAVALVYRSLRRRRKALCQMQALRDAAEEARRALERAVEQQKRFTANAAHELRTPLAVLRARIDGQPPSPERETLQRDVDRMARLVEQLLAVARLEGRLVTLSDGVDLVAVARDTVARLFPLALSNGREIALTAPDRPVTVRGDTFALEDALRNLIDNALRHSPPGETVEVTVSADPLALEVADRGSGVPTAVRPHLFEPFCRGADSKGGAGLGLAIVSETATIHNATVSVEDRPGGGTRFRLLFAEGAHR